jgi:hypothetical protein
VGVHDNAVATALRLIRKHGRTITVTKGSDTPTSAAQPWRGSDDEYTTTLADSRVETKGVFVHPSSVSDFGFLETSEFSLHKRGTKLCLVAASGLADLSSHEGIQDGDELWRIENIHVLKPGDTIIMYVFEVAQ